MGSLQNKSVSTAVGVALGAAALGGALAAGARCIQLVRTRAGRARVKVLKLEDGSEVRVLAQGGVFQSATYLGERWSEPVFEYIRAFDTMFEALPQMRAWYAHGIGRVLMLGGGGFSYPKALLTARDDVWMDVVEADPAIVQMARRWFYLDRLEQEVGPRLGICTEDARVYLERISMEGAQPVLYDVVISDVFAGADPVRSVATVQALQRVREHLTPGGLYMANIVSRDHGTDISFLRDALASALRVFAHASVIQTTDEELGEEDNYLLIASDEDYSFADAIAYGEDFPGEPLFD